MSHNIFITATGTDVGKTYISALILKKMRELGYNWGYFKPVLSGVVSEGGKLLESDCNYVLKTANIPEEADDCVAYWWEEAVSPHLAAKRVNQSIETKRIIDKFNLISKKFDYMLIEGAGGITCPIRLENNEKYLLKDLIKEFDCPVIIVADAGLGTINSTLLTVEYANLHNIPILGIILNRFNPKSFMQQDNLKQLEYLTGKKVIATVENEACDINLTSDFIKQI